MHGRTVLWIVAAVVGLCCAALVFIIWMFESLRHPPELNLEPAHRYERTLTVAADIDFEPYSFLDAQGRPSGHDVELAYALGEKLGMNVEMRLMNWTAAREAVRLNQADLLMGLEYLPESLPEFTLSMPIHTDPFVAFGRKTLKNVGELHGKRLAVLENSGSFAGFLIPYRLQDATTVYPGYEAALRSVALDENDYAVVRYSVGRRTLARLADLDEVNVAGIKATGPQLASIPLALGSAAANRELMARVDQALLELSRNGTLDALSRKWLGNYVDVLNFQEFLKYNAGVFAAVAAALLAMALLGYAAINHRMMRLARGQRDDLARVIEYQELLTEATKGLYESIHEFDITHNRVHGESTLEYLRGMGLDENTSYSDFVHIVAAKQLAKPFIKGFLTTFMPRYVHQAYARGITNLRYDFLYTPGEGRAYWHRVTARLFFWKTTRSLHMITYRQNIDAEKRYEMSLLQAAQRDSLTGLYNKQATGDLIAQTLSEPASEAGGHAFLLLDIDHFKLVNDNYGHAFGDMVIAEFAATLRSRFRDTDILGRIGGDEFVVFLRHIPDMGWLRRQVGQLARALDRDVIQGENMCHISASIGVAVSPRDGTSFEILYRKADAALYLTKKKGRNGFSFYDEVED